MSGQPDYELESRAFDAFMGVIDWTYGEEDPRNKTKFSEKMIEWYRNAGYPNWHDYYDLDTAAVGAEIQDKFGSMFDIPDADESATAEGIADIFEDLLQIIQSESSYIEELPEREFVLSDLKWNFTARAQRISLWCQLQHKCTIADLLANSKDGDIDAFLKLVRLDSTFLATETGRRFLAETELQNNLSLRKRLAQVIDSSEGFWKLEGGKKHIRDGFALWIMSQIGFRDKPYSVWADFLDRKGFDNLADEGAVKEACHRYGIEKTYPSHRRKSKN